MRSSYRLLKVSGISIELHWSFILFFLFLLLVVGLSDFIALSIIFLLVLMHELSHSLIAKLSGIPVPRIILLPFGGLASIEIPENPKLELGISIAGPLLNFIIAGICITALLLTHQDPASYAKMIQQIENGGQINILHTPYLLSLIASVNLMLALFNMLPAFPMDGGRILRSVLALWMDYVKATEIAAKIGQTIFLLLMMAGLLMSNLWWILIGLFLSFAGGSELKMVGMRRAFEGLTVGQIASKKISYALDTLTVKEFMNLIAKPDQTIYLIFDASGILKGVLDLRDLTGVKQKRDNLVAKKIKDYAKKEFTLIDGKTPAEKALKNLLTDETIIVTDANKVVGYLTPEYVMNEAVYYMLKKQ